MGPDRVGHLPGVQPHRPGSDGGKDVLHLEIMQRAGVGEDLAQPRLQRRNIPGAIIQLIEELSQHVLGRRGEGEIERTAGGNHAQIVVEDEQRLPDRVHNGFGKCARVRRVGKLLLEHVVPSLRNTSPRHEPFACPAFKRRNETQSPAASYGS